MNKKFLIGVVVGTCVPFVWRHTVIEVAHQLMRREIDKDLKTLNEE